jgi:tRNA dimethylallyltransferase
MAVLLVVLGPTGAGKTALGVEIAERYGCPIISADSRQIYRELPVGTAAPTTEQRARAIHYYIGTLSVGDYFSASMFETETLRLLEDIFTRHKVALCVGGSMMYLDALCYGIDEIPTIEPEVRRAVVDLYEREGPEPLLDELRRCDPVHYDEVDRSNYRRVIHAVEICRQSGRPYSSFRTHKVRHRPFDIVKIGLTLPRDELCERINRRVDEMIEAGLIDEARSMYPFRELNALNTVGYKELFRYFDGEWTLDFAIEKIKRNTRVYARKQMTWFRRDKTIEWFEADDRQAIFAYIEKKIGA